ncbi:hypothetical protein BDQ17DRAFT_1346573 [Cyathus striatus]|nr:hypothetical protein BDQ17DRAFT_1346573 [Cyathus striatus]
MQRRDSHPYTYDDSNAYYPGGQVSSQTSEYPMAAIPYPQTGYDSSGYYVSNQNAAGATEPQASQYIRSMTPALSPGHRYASGSRQDPRYYQPQGIVSSSSSVPHASYPSQGQYYPAPSDHRVPPSGHAAFIPTPTDMTNSYSTYPLPGSSPVVADQYSGNYPHPPHVVPSSQAQIPRPGRISTSRPRTSTGATTSPTSTSSPSGERFPCEKCGKTFSRSHDRKRHHETQHLASPVIHRCRYCEKEFSRADSLKRHLDNGCDEMP